MSQPALLSACRPRRRQAAPGATGRPSSCRHHLPDRPRRCVARAAAEQPLNDAAQKLESNDRIGALKEWESALKSNALSDSRRRVLLYNCVAVHAAMGDLELAQVPLREALALGLDLDDAIANPEPGMVPWRSSRQVIIAMRRFATKYTSKALAKPKGVYKPATGVILTPEGIRAAMSEQDVGGILGTEIKGADMDKSLLGMAKRVAALLVALVGLGAGLFYFGLQFMFPEAQ